MFVDFSLIKPTSRPQALILFYNLFFIIKILITILITFLVKLLYVSKSLTCVASTVMVHNNLILFKRCTLLHV